MLLKHICPRMFSDNLIALHSNFYNMIRGEMDQGQGFSIDS